MEDAFYFILKALFVLKIFKFLSRLFGHVEKRPGTQTIVDTYFPISPKIKEIRQLNLVSLA